MNNTTLATQPTTAPKRATSRSPTRDETIIRQNALSHADELILYISKWATDAPLSTEDFKKAYFAFAEECEQWVHREVKQ